MTRGLYTFLLWLVLPLLPLRLLLRARRQREYLQHWPERFGRYAHRGDAPWIWIHAVSVGETHAAKPLVACLLQRYPQHRIVLTHMTPTGRATSGQLFADEPRVQRGYLPYDYPFAVRRFLEHFRPELGLIMETELWPNLIAACKHKGTPLLLVNARMSERSARGYAKAGRLTRETLSTLTAIAAQTEADAARLRRLGAPKVSVLGNLKFDLTASPAQLDLGKQFRERTAGRKLLLCASTREGEEALILDALRSVDDSGLLCVMVPRHPQRFDSVAALIQSRGFRMQRRSQNTAAADETRVLLGDSMGEMFAYYASADVAFIGGSLLPLGGQNLIEACAVGTPVLVGPHTFNFLEATRQAIAAGAALRVDDAHALVAEASRLFADDAARAAMAQAGREFALKHRGATERTMSLIAAYLK